MTRRVSRRQVLGYGAAAVAAGVAAPGVAPGPAQATPKQAPATPKQAQAAPKQAQALAAKDARPRFRYWWPGGGVTTAEITKEVEAIADAGFGGFELADVRNSQMVAMPTAVYAFGNDTWKAGVVAALRAANARGLKVDLTVGPYWPAVAPGVKPDDDAAMKELTYGQAVIAGGTRFRDSVPAAHSAPSGASVGPAVTVTPVLQAVHAAQISGDTTAKPLVLKSSTILDLTDRVRNGSLDWTAPEGGDWVIVASWSRGTAMIEKQAYYQGYFYSFTQPQAYVVDHFGRPGADAVVHWWESDLLTTEMRRLLKANGGNFFEDSLEFNTELHWTPRLREEFRARRGYDPRALLPLVHGQSAAVYTTDDRVTGEGVRWDYFQTLSDLYLANHVRPLDAWARTLGMRLRNQAYGAPLDAGLLASQTGVPEGESLAFGSEPDSFRLLAAGRDLGNRRVLSSELGAQGTGAYRLTLADLVRTANVGYGLGVNQVRIHGFSYAAGPGSRWPGFYPWAPIGGGFNFSENWSPRVPQWQVIGDVAGYLARTQTVLQAGRARVDVAIYRQAFDSTSTQYDGAALTAAGYSYQVISWGLLQLGHDLPYGALIVDRQSTLLTGSARSLLAYARRGLPIVVVGDLATGVPDLDRGGRQAAELAKVLATLTAQRSVRTVATEADVPAALAALKVVPGAVAGGLLHVRREADGVTYHYLHNPGSAPVSVQAALRGSGVPYRIDAWTGQETRLPVYDSSRRGFLTVPVDAAAGEAVIIAVRPGTARHATSSTAPLVVTSRGLSARTTAAGRVSAVLDDGRTVAVTASAPVAAPVLGSWRVRIEDWQAADPDATGAAAVPTRKTVHDLTLATLTPWRQLDGLADAAGVGTYTTTFTLAAATGATLSLGSVGAGSARVEVNGTKLGPINHLDPVIDLGALLRAGRNTLVVTVATTLINRMRAQQPSDFTPAAQDYGLLGPVTITPYVQTPL